MVSLRQKLTWLILAFLIGPLLFLGCDPDDPNFDFGCRGSSGGKHSLTVDIESGKLKGSQNDHARMFKGIPFAAPPTGELRWKAPQDPIPWKGILHAAESRNVCVQAEMSPTWHASGELIGDEDCLYLDLYRPKTNAENLPVYVYFHGGANRFGGAASYDGSYLAEKENVVVVIPQYRLGPLGWFRHPALRTGSEGDEADDSGNFGTLDNIKALEWVRKNITAFGGDPARVTIGGQSAGASNVAKLLISPMAAGLFQGAVLQSLGGDIISPQAGDAKAGELLAALNYDPAVDGDDIAVYLRSRTAREISSAYTTDHAGFADGRVLPGRYVDVIYDGEYNPVPVMLGSTEYEFKNFLPLYGASFGHPNWANVYDLFEPEFDPSHEWTFEEIFPTQAEVDLYEAMGKYQSAGWKYKSVDELAALLKNRQEGVYAYLFKWGEQSSASREFAHIFGPAHAMEIPFFLGYDHDLFGYALTDENRAGFEALQEMMMTYLGNFIRNGDPGETSGVVWEQWSNDGTLDAPKCIVLDADMTSAQVAMDIGKITPEALQAEAAAQVSGWSEEDAGLVLSMLTTAPAASAEYLLNDEGYELRIGDLTFESLEGTTSEVYWGVHAQAGYQIELPENWTPGSHDLVMYAHGYRGETQELAVAPPTRLRPYLMENTIAWAASSYTANGYNITSGVTSTADLLAHFKSRFGEPRRVYLVGHSMGGHITARTVADSEYKADYAGALPMCGVVGGATDLFNYHLDWGLAVSYFAGLNLPVPYSDTDLALLSETLFGPDGSGIGALGEIPVGNGPFFPYDGTAALLNDAGENLKDAMMYRSGGARPLFDNAFSLWAQFMIDNAMERLADPTSELGMGNIAGNMSTEYHLDRDGVLDTTPEEDQLNGGIQRVDDPAADFSPLMWPVSGNIEIPVLSLHTLGDMYVPFSMEQLWARRIGEAGNSDLFRTRAVRALGHCTFTEAEEAEAFDALVNWVENGKIPGGDNILDSATVEAEDFGCIFTSQGRPLEDPAYERVCLP